MRLLFAVLAVLFACSSAQAASCQYTNSGRVICRGTSSQMMSARRHTYRTRRRGSPNCPRRLGCGCNLANEFGGIARFGRHMWRELWVARNWRLVGKRASRGCTGCVVVLSRGRRGGHVGIVRHYDANGNPVVYSYANARRGWTVATYPKRRVLGYRRL